MKKITNYKIQNTNKFQITMPKITNNKLNKSFCRGLCANCKAQGAKQIIRLTLYAKRYAPCAFPLAAGGKENKIIRRIYNGKEK
jgi:hypothetical protein